MISIISMVLSERTVGSAILIFYIFFLFIFFIYIFFYVYFPMVLIREHPIGTTFFLNLVFFIIFPIVLLS